MVENKTLGSKIFDVFNVLFMIFMMVITLYPFYYVVTCSLSDSNQLVLERGLMLLPKGFSLDAYVAVFNNPNIWTGYRTTLFIVVVGTTMSVIATAFGAFLLTRKNFAIKNFIAYMMLLTMYFGGGMIPTYLLVNNILGFHDSLWALIIPNLISTYNLIIMKSNFSQIPDSIEESATIDGANDFVIFFKIILPLSLPIIAVMFLYYGVGYWNSWFSAMLYIRSKSKFPLQLILREILLINQTSEMTDAGATGDAYAIGESIKYATTIVATLPILCVYPFIQKYFVKGVMIGAVKG